LGFTSEARASTTSTPRMDSRSCGSIASGLYLGCEDQHDKSTEAGVCQLQLDRQLSFTSDVRASTTSRSRIGFNGSLVLRISELN
jgi:hypothetical protein